MFSPGTILLGKYRVDEILGVGGYGYVLRAHDLANDVSVAIKVLRADIELDRENLERFLREARAGVALRSEHVVRIDDFGRFDDGSPYMVMELLDGVDLGRLLASRGPLPIAHAADIMLQVCVALADAHALGIFHRDIKPTNLFATLHSDGSELIKVLDFGIAKVANVPVSLTQSTTILGTPTYMSPEQMRSARDVDGRSDIWSLGAVLYELVEGHVAFPAPTFPELVVMVATEQPAPLVAAPALAHVIARCLGKRPDDRYRDLAELASAIAPFAAASATTQARVARIHRALGQTPGALPPAAPVRIRRKRRLFAPLLIGSVVVAAAAATLVVVTHQPAPPRVASAPKLDAAAKIDAAVPAAPAKIEAAPAKIEAAKVDVAPAKVEAAKIAPAKPKLDPVAKPIAKPKPKPAVTVAKPEPVAPKPPCDPYKTLGGC
jgi:serine/threonine-protein kinase